MGVSQSIFKVIKSEVIGFPRLQSLRCFSCLQFRPWTGGRGARIRVVNCGGVGGGVDI